MLESRKLEFSQLEVGSKLLPGSFTLNVSIISDYLKAVEDTSQLYEDSRIVPPAAMGAYAMIALNEVINLPPGTIHVSQEFEFSAEASINDSFTSHAEVSRKRSRGQLKLLSIDFTVHNQNQKPVLSGKSTFTLPEQDNGD